MTGYKVLPYPRMRRLVQDAGWMARRRHMIHGLVEVDVTQPRAILRQIKASTGESLSFTAFILACLGQAVEQDKRAHAIRNWRNQLIVFDDVDVMLTIEIDVGSEKFPLVHTMRGINRRTTLDMHQEIRVIQASPASSVAARGWLMRWFYLLPGAAPSLAGLSKRKWTGIIAAPCTLQKNRINLHHVKSKSHNWAASG